MALVFSLEATGNFLFKRRGWLPVLLFVLVLPALYFTPYSSYASSTRLLLSWGGIMLSFVGFLIRAYVIGTTPRGTSGRNTKGQVAEELNQTGIYSIVRHPLYLGNYFMWIGIIVFAGNFCFILIASLLFWLYYERIMFAEERFLERKFGATYLNWAQKTPAFVPSFRLYRSTSIPFSIKSVLRREYPGVLNTVIGFAYVEMWRQYFITKQFGLSHGSYVALFFAVVLALTLKTLKRQTSWLEESGRS